MNRSFSFSFSVAAAWCAVLLPLHAQIVVVAPVSPYDSPYPDSPWVVAESLNIGSGGSVLVQGGGTLRAEGGWNIDDNASLVLNGGTLAHGSLANPIDLDAAQSGFQWIAGVLQVFGELLAHPTQSASGGESAYLLDSRTLNLIGANARWADLSHALYLGDAIGTNAALQLESGAAFASNQLLIAGYRGSGFINASDSTLTTSGNAFFGFASGSSGSAALSNSTWQSNALLTLGYASGASGAMSLQQHSLWSTLSDVFLGLSGQANAHLTSSSTWNATGPVTLAMNASSAASLHLDGAAWNSLAAVTVSESGYATLDIDNGAVWNASGPVSIASGFGGQGFVRLRDQGSLWHSADAVLLAADANAAATVSISNGAQWFAEKGITFGLGASLVVLDGGRLQVGTDAAPIAFNPPVDSFQFVSGELFLTQGPCFVDSVAVGRHVNLPANAIFAQNALLSGGKVSWRGDADLNAARLTIQSGALDLAGTLSGLHSINSLTQLTLSGSNALWPTAAASLLEGQVHLDGGTVAIADGSSLTVLPGAQLSFADSTGGSILVDGTLNHASYGTLNLSAQSEIVGSGRVFGDVSIGTNASQGRLFGTSATEPLAVYGDVSGSGIIGNLSLFGNNAIGNSPGQQFWSGSVTLSPAGTLSMDIGGDLGPGRDDGFSQIVVMADATVYFAGTLKVNAWNGFVPTEPTEFSLFVFELGCITTGTFSDVSLFSLPDGLFWDTSRLESDGVLAIIPEPSAQLLFCAFALLLVFHRRFFPDFALH